MKKCEIFYIFIKKTGTTEVVPVGVS